MTTLYTKAKVDDIILGRAPKAVPDLGHLAPGAEAYALTGEVPVRPAPKPKITWLHRFDAGHGWTVTGAASSELNDVTDSPAFTQSLRVTTTGTGVAAVATRLNHAPVDMTGRNPVITVKTEDVARLRSVVLIEGSDAAAFTNFRQWTMDDTGGAAARSLWSISGDYACAVLPWDKHSSSGGAINRAAIISTRVRVTDDGTGPVTARIGGIGYAPAPAPSVIAFLTCDDGFDSFITRGKPITDAAGYPVSAFLIPGANGISTPAGLAKWQQAQNTSGWEIAGHAPDAAVHDARFVGRTAEDADFQMRRLKAWLLRIGARGHDHGAWPAGLYDLNSEAAARRYFAYFRGTAVNVANVFPTPTPHRLFCATSSGNNPAAMLARFDANAAAGLPTIFAWHDLDLAISSGVKTSVADFQTVITGLVTRGADVRLLGDYLRTVAA